MTPADPIWPDAPEPASGPLRGVKVLDLTTVLMGPSATQMLGDLGADVLKIETPAGDTMRWIGPWRHPGMGPLYLQANRNKRSLVLDLKSPEGKTAILALAAQADIFVANIRPQGLHRLGLDAATLRAINPSIIYCTAVGYGAGGPDSGKAVYDDLMQAASGISALFAKVEGTPRYAPINLCDRIVGLYLVNALTAALYHRAMTGEGQDIEVPMFETMVQFVLADHMGGAAFVPPAGEMGYRRLLSRTRRPFATADGYLAVMVYSNRDWQAFASLVGEPDLLATDPRFANQEARTQNAEFAGSYLAGHMLTRSSAEWLPLLQNADIPACPVTAIEDLFTHPHLTATGFFEDHAHPTEGTLKTPCFPVKFSATPASIRQLAPNLGEHNKEIFGQD